MANIPIDAATYFFGAVYYDHVLSKNRRSVLGRQPTAAKKAIYLIYPAHGLLPSHLRTLAYFRAKGVSATVVSNLPLPLEDEAKLLNLCTAYIERPNFGYDFGGYRDGVLSLEHDLANTEQLVLMNDSSWFPLYPESDWLANAEALGVDFVGSVSNGYKSAFPKVMDPVFNRGYRDDDKLFHYGSFALWIGHQVLHDPKFMLFWKKFPLSNRKRQVIMRGEIGLTRWVRKNGFSHGSTFDVTGLEVMLKDLSDARLAEIAQNMIILGNPSLSTHHYQTLQQMAPASRSELIKRILTITDRQGAGYSLAFFLTLELKHPFLKKAPLRDSMQAAQITLRVLEKIQTEAASEALDEAKRHHRQLLDE
ncbi:rhamnan synthesis protein F [Loktanella sp. PT4BL]|jgi:lipopolysaccharide biosynthesis protein|nr:rhamnan synthesis protein F [Loktanella sp. PT4BL]